MYNSFKYVIDNEGVDREEAYPFAGKVFCITTFHCHHVHKSVYRFWKFCTTLLRVLSLSGDFAFLCCSNIPVTMI